MPTTLFAAGRAILRRRVNDTPAMDFDGFEAVPAGLPIFLLNPVHVWGWRRTANDWSLTKRSERFSFRAMPIRWSAGLVIRTLLRHWLWLPALVGLVLALSCAHGAYARAAGLLLLLTSVGAWSWIIWSDGHYRQIRRLLGRHRLGFSDPVEWTDDLLKALPTPEEWFGHDTFGQAAAALLDQGRVREAMWAARLCAALENKAGGERLTAEILAAPEAAAVLAGREERRKPRRGEDVRHFPPLEQMRLAEDDFWHVKISGREGAQAAEQITYAGHLGGQIAAAMDTDDQETEEEATRQHEEFRDRAGFGTSYLLGGVAGVAGLILGVIVFALVANLDRPNRGPAMPNLAGGGDGGGRPGGADAPPRAPKRQPVAAGDVAGLVAAFGLDEGVGNDLREGAGKIASARIHNAAWVRGIRGSALAFDGKASFVELPPGPPLDFAAGQAFTLSCWFAPKTGEGTVLSFRRKGDGAPVIDVFLARWQVRATVRADGQEAGDVTVAGGKAGEGWQHVALTRDAAGEVQIYLNGLARERARGGNTAGAITTDLRALGCERYWLNGFGAAQPYFDGMIDEFAAYRRVLTEGEIALLAGQDPP